MIFVIGGIAVLAWLYVKQENTLYFHDFSFFHLSTSLIKDTFLQNPLTATAVAYMSTMRTYNLLYTLPLVPFELIFGDSRTAYIEGLTVLYLLPYIFTSGIIFGALTDGSKRLSIWIGALTAATIPCLWATVLRGYPDVLGALMVNIAIIIYLKEPQLTSTRKSILIGVFLALSALVRRHFLFADLAFGCAVLVHQSALSKLTKNLAGRTATIARIKGVMTIGFTALVVLSTVGFLFVSDLLSHNYPRIYAAFHVPVGQATEYFGVSFGLALWVMAVVGNILLLVKDRSEHRLSWFVVCFSLLNMLVWLLLGGQLGIHYNLHFCPFIIIGISNLLYVGITGGALLRYTVLPFAACFLIGNGYLALSPLSTVKSLPWKMNIPGWLNIFEQKGDAIGSTFSANYHPLVRDDFDDVFRLVWRLKELAPGEKRAMIVAGSEILNDDTIKNAERQLFNIKKNTLHISKASYTDTEESFPLEQVLNADAVVVAHPVQFFVDKENQKVLQVAANIFDENWDAAQDFEKVSNAFFLDNSVTVTVYHRVKPTSLETAVKTLERIKSFVGKRPLGQPDWINTGEVSDTAFESKRNKFFFPCAEPDKSTTVGADRYLFSVEELPINGSVHGVLEYTCASTPPAVEFLLLDDKGTVLKSQSIKLDKETKFSLKNETNAPAYACFKIGQTAKDESVPPPPGEPAPEAKPGIQFSDLKTSND